MIVDNAEAAGYPDKVGGEKKPESLRQRKTTIRRMPENLGHKRETHPSEQKHIPIPDDNKRDFSLHTLF